MKERIAVIILAIIHIAIVVLVLSLIIQPSHGRKYTIPLIDGMVIQADPPEKKLLKYMEEKYDTEFRVVNFPGSYRHHSFPTETWGFYYNGITVSTVSGSLEYYHVRDDYGTYLDNYGCYLINEEAEQLLYDKISSVLDDEVKVSCYPMDYQSDELPAYMTAEEYLDMAGHWVCIVICGDGENAEEDYKEICNIFNNKTGRGWMTMHYVNEEVYNRIDMENRTMIIENKDYIKRLRFDPRTSEPSFVVPGEFVY